MAWAAGNPLAVHPRFAPDIFNSLSRCAFNKVCISTKNFFVRTDDRSIDECQTYDGETPTFKGREARAVLTALNATGDDEEAFTRVGAYSVLGGKKPPKTKAFLLDDGRALRVWRYPTEIVTATRRTEGKGWRWSRFYLEDDRWDCDWNNSLMLGELFQLALTRPDIRKALGVLD